LDPRGELCSPLFSSPSPSSPLRARPLQPSRVTPCGPGAAAFGFGGAARPCSLPPRRRGPAPAPSPRRRGPSRPCSFSHGGAAPHAPAPLPHGGAARPCFPPRRPRPWRRPPCVRSRPPAARLPSPLTCSPSAPSARRSRPRCAAPALGSVDPGTARVASARPRAPPFTPTRSRVHSPTRAVIYSWSLINFKLRLVSVLRRATNLFNFRFY
jgi:hypothetical protein